MENSILCSKCGASNEAGSAFCTKCGNSLAKTEVVDNISNNESYTQEELSLFLEKNQSYYLEKFNLIEKTGDKTFIGWALSLALCVGLGIFGNSIYLDHIKKTFSEIGFADSNMRSTLINKKGGTNLVLPILLAVIPVIIGIIASIFIGIMCSVPYYY